VRLGNPRLMLTMKSDVLKSLVRRFAVLRGFRTKGPVAWKRQGELTGLLHLQFSKWGSGCYVNFGYSPSSMVKAAPPGPEYWGYAERAEGFESPFRETFRLLAQGDSEDPPLESEVERGFGWLLEWLDYQIENAQVMRHKIRESPIANEWGVMTDWARGELREPRFYFPDGKYFRVVD